MDTRRFASWALAAVALLLAAAAAPPAPPTTLAQTGFDEADRLLFTPQYPLWSDGAAKRRWLHVPRGRTIDASDADAWVFPPGTKLWKEFALGGRRLETRLIERLPDGSWRFAAYAWSADGHEARLVPEAGAELSGVQGAPGGRWRIPSRDDCLACHGSAAVPVLGAGAVQLSPPRPAVDGIDASTLVARGWLRNHRAMPMSFARSDVERAALGLLHANCGHCHNRSVNRVPVPLTLAQSAADPAGAAAAALRSLTHLPARRHGGPVVVPGDAPASLLLQRMATRAPRTRMPPLGTEVPDADGLALVERWITSLPTSEN
ncbi:c-type cytochrome domain-containing protein [uncultured Piscinibacter sp.]|uniref:c-type cytochrome domain-containing protein n=1 Tax=uncultured Piscinibacter sp. TaxID=1131835 RepID=UPI00261E8A54|nr:c-type cytochrome domain-containing protein [uncultured Piscinibacter sp.]